jgi:hypothetical protein
MKELSIAPRSMCIVQNPLPRIRQILTWSRRWSVGYKRVVVCFMEARKYVGREMSGGCVRVPLHEIESLASERAREREPIFHTQLKNV